jgi:hypothetical protein
MVLILATDGLLHVHVASDLDRVVTVALAPFIVQAFSGRMYSTLGKVAGARILTGAEPHMLAGNMW